VSSSGRSAADHVHRSFDDVMTDDT